MRFIALVTYDSLQTYSSSPLFHFPKKYIEKCVSFIYSIVHGHGVNEKFMLFLFYFNNNNQWQFSTQCCTICNSSYVYRIPRASFGCLYFGPFMAESIPPCCTRFDLLLCSLTSSSFAVLRTHKSCFFVATLLTLAGGVCKLSVLCIKLMFILLSIVLYYKFTIKLLEFNV